MRSDFSPAYPYNRLSTAIALNLFETVKSRFDYRERIKDYGERTRGPYTGADQSAYRALA